jgi:hypothetical protein
VTRPAPGRNFAHLNARIRNAGGTKGDSAAGSREAAGEHYRWIDNNGHSSSDAWPFNMHGAPFNPMWIRPGRQAREAPGGVDPAQAPEAADG